MQIDGPLQAADEGLGALGQLVEALAQRPERAVRLGDIGLLRRRQQRQLAEQRADVAERRGLQLAGTAHVLLEVRNGTLGCLALRAQLIEEARLIKLLDRGDIGGIGVLVEISPFAELPPVATRAPRGQGLPPPPVAASECETAPAPP